MSWIPFPARRLNAINSHFPALFLFTLPLIREQIGRPADVASPAARAVSRLTTVAGRGGGGPQNTVVGPQLQKQATVDSTQHTVHRPGHRDRRSWIILEYTPAPLPVTLPLHQQQTI